MKNSKILLVSLITILGTCLSSCGQDINSNTNDHAQDYILELTKLDYVDFHSELQREFLNDDYRKISLYAKGDKEYSRPESIYFEWDPVQQIQEAIEIKNYTLMISEDINFSTYSSFTTVDTYYDVYNLKIATTYYWKVKATLNNGTQIYSDVDDFETMDYGPRNLYVDGVTNVRDLGGWETEDGRVKQGMIFRSGRFNKSSNSNVLVEVTLEGIDTMLNTLNVKSEIDLRMVSDNEIGGITSSPIDESVNYYSCPMDYRVSNLLTDNIEMVKQVFSILADKNNYPVVYHCNIGTDRTGLYAFLINGLLGVDENDLYVDYLFSNFGYIHGTRDLTEIKNSYIATIKSYDGETLSEKIKNCLIDKGVNEQHLTSIIEILSN